MIYYKLAAIFRSGYFFQWDWVSLHSCAMNNTKSGDKVWATAYISECLRWNDKQVYTCAWFTCQRRHVIWDQYYH